MYYLTYFMWVASTNGTEFCERPFTDIDEAIRWAEENIAPDRNGSIFPNVPQNYLEELPEDEYVKGLFWLGNRYAVIVNRL